MEMRGWAGAQPRLQGEVAEVLELVQGVQELFCCLQESSYRCPGVALSSSEVAEPLQEHPQLFSCWSPDQFLPGHL